MDQTAHGTIHELLPWYLTGTLQPNLAGEFREHLSGCESCRNEMAILEAMRAELGQHGEALLEDHPSAERVVGAVRGELADDDAAAVRRHLALCSTCAEEASWVAGEAAFRDATTDRGGTPRIGRVWSWAAGIAAVLVLGSIPLFLVFGPVGIRTGVVEVHHLESSQRGSAQSNVFARQPGQPVRLILQVDLPPEGFPLRLTLVDGKERTVHSQSGVTSLLDGYLHYVCADADCPAGRYTLEVYESGSTEPALFFDFEVVEP